MISNFSFWSVALGKYKEMEENYEFTPQRLEMCTYRYLQQISKKMGLPSNVKKVQLIDLIHAKKSRTPEEVESIIQRVKLDRLRLSQAKKNRRNRKKIRLQGTEISSSSTIQSPPITATPKRRLAIRYSPEHKFIQYKPRPTVFNLNKTLIRKTYPSPKKSIESDRVLRSFNVKANYGIMNSVIGVIKAQNSMANQETRINIFGQDGRTQRLNVTAIVRKRPAVSNGLALKNERPVQVSRAVTTSRPIKRPRALSGIYPLEDIPKPDQYINTIQQDEKLSQINTYLQPNYHMRNEHDNDVTLQDIINSNVNQSLSNEYNCDSHDNDNENDDSQSCLYYHKKIRSDQVKSIVQKDSLWALPKINDVFSQFNDVHRRDLCQPIYVQVSEESERLQNYPQYMVNQSVNNTTMLESLYNFKNQFVLNHPLLQVATTTSTRCVFSTPTIATPMAQPSHTVVSNEYYQTSRERDSQVQYSTNIESIPRMYDYFRITEQEIALRRDFRCNEVMSTSSSSLETGQDSSQELGANVTIPEMVEDALELISQDGDYMERIGMDPRMQCILCPWAGPRIILEYHVRKYHSNEIQSPNTNESTITYTVGRLVEQNLWLGQVIEYDSVLYVLSAKYEDPDCFMLNIAMISQDTITPKYAKITLYNKVTGEPHSWQGEIHEITPSTPYGNQKNCLKVELSKLDLLPNSANLKLLNRQLVIKSPTKVIVGQPELDNIHIVVFLRFLNYL